MTRAGLSAPGRGRQFSRRVRAAATAAAAIAPLLLAACSHHDQPSGRNAPAVLASDNGAAGAIKLVGVPPSAFRCSSMATPKEVGAIVGAKVVLHRSQFQPPQGVAAPCNYVAVAAAKGASAAGAAQEPSRRAGKSRRTGKSKRARHSRRARKHPRAGSGDSAPPPAPAQPMWSVDFDCRATAIKDAESLMVQYAKTDGAKPVRVGKSGLDYEHAALLFIDNDSRCYARVLGPGAKNRLAIAKLVAGRLTATTAPMIPVVRTTARSH